MENRLATAASIASSFVIRTQACLLSVKDAASKRYLWTDAYAVMLLLGLNEAGVRSSISLAPGGGAVDFRECATRLISNVVSRICIRISYHLFLTCSFVHCLTAPFPGLFRPKRSLWTLRAPLREAQSESPTPERTAHRKARAGSYKLFSGQL